MRRLVPLLLFSLLVYALASAASGTAPYDVLVNAGGAAYTDRNGQIWLADKAYSPGSWGYIGGSTYSTAAAIANTDDDTLYQTERWGLSQYRFDVAPGEYRVELYFAEIYCSSASCRSLDVLIEGTTVLSNLNIYALVGRNAAYVRSFTVPVSDGALNIGFVARTGAAKINALRVTLVTPSSPTATATATNTPGPTNTPTVTFTPGPPTATPTATLTTTATPTRVCMFRVNAGGPAYTDSNGNVWSADQFFDGSWGWWGSSSTSSTGVSIESTNDDPLYQTDRYWTPSGTPAYRFIVSDGTYEVTLKFAETMHSAAGLRRFDIRLEGITYAAAFDIFSAAGGMNRAVDRVFTVDVTDGQLNVALVQVVGAPKVNAIQVCRLGSVTVTPTRSATPVNTATPTRSATPTNTATRTPTPVTTGTYQAVFQQGINGYGGNANATIDSWNPDANAGSPTGVLNLRTFATGGLMRFDLSSLSTDAYVTRAILRLYVLDRTNPNVMTLEMYRLLRPWRVREATWHVAGLGDDWAKPGANDTYLDRAPSPAATVLISTTAAFYDIDITALVRDWVRYPDTNHGMLIAPTGTGSVMYRIIADGFFQVDKRPRLTISYSIDDRNDFPPAIAITSPRYDQFVTGILPITVNVRDDKGIEYVRYTLDGATLATLDTSPYTYNLDTSTLTLGRHRLAARVRDTAGNIRDHWTFFNVYRTDHGILTIAHITDLHLGTPWQGWPGNPAVHLHRFDLALTEMHNIIKPAVIINTGDTTTVGDEYSYRIYAATISTATIPIKTIPGNHDLASGENFLNFVGPMKMSFDIGLHRFIGFTTNALDVPWLNALLASTDKKGIIFSHYLMRLPAGAMDSPWFYCMSDAEVAALRQAMLAYGAPAYLSGHFHEPFLFADTVSGAVEIGGPALGAKSAYVIITSDNGIISSNLHYLGDWPEIVITSPQRFYPDGGSKTISGSVKVRAKIYGASPITAVTATVPGLPATAMTPLGGNVYEMDWNTATVAPGVHTITVAAQDSAGRSRQTSIQVKVVSP